MQVRKVRVGHPLAFYSREDRWGRLVRDLDPPSFGKLDADLWHNVRLFQEHEPSAEVTEFAHRKLMAPMLIELQNTYLLNPQRSATWQLCLDKGGDRFVRVCTVFMGGAKLIQYRWWHVIGATALGVAAWIFNKTVAKWRPIRYDLA